MLYRHIDDIEKLQKVIADTEKQFVDCRQQINMLGEEKEQRQKELEDLRVAADSSLKWWICWKTAQQTGDPCWGDFVKLRKKSSTSSPRPPQHMLAMP
jgi:hypothetical protein